MRERPVKRTSRKPKFFWQGVLILAPMLVLAKVGALAIWQDKRMAEHEANLRAQDLAEQVAEKIADTWMSLPLHGLMNLDSNANLVQPRPIALHWATTKAQPGDEPSALLDRARTAEFISGDKEQAIQLYRQFLETKPSGDAAQPARYSLGLLLLTVGDTTNASRVFHELINDDADARGDAGGDLKTLALFKLALLSQMTFDAVCRRAVQHPTQLTPEILRAVFNHPSNEAKRAAEEWWGIWSKEELQRFLHSQMRPFFKPQTKLLATVSPGALEPPVWIWVSATNEQAFLRGPDGQPRAERPADFVGDDAHRNSTTSWMMGRRVDTSRLLNSSSDGQGGYTVRVYRAPDITRWALNVIEEFRPPLYFGVSLSVDGHDVVHPDDLPTVVARGGGKGAGRIWVETTRGTNAPAPLATAARRHGNVLPIVARVHLVGPDLLFEQQNARSMWFRMVVAVAALTSIVGFISAYRAFHKQLRLAEMKSNFVSSVSHELRAPIASVRLMAEGLERGKVSDPAKQREYFRFITQECRRLSSMIENVLDFARIEQDRKQYEFEPTDVAALVQQTVKLMEPYAVERGVRLSLVAAEVTRLHSKSAGSAASDEIDQSLLTSAATVVNIDGQAIQQALVNLIDNAIKHSATDSEVTVTLETREQSQSTIHRQPSTLLLSVADHGPGIPASEHEKIFERFYRLGSELRRETPGVGIGLSIVKHVVEAHGGQIRVESEMEKGSRFTIELPVSAETQNNGGSS